LTAQAEQNEIMPRKNGVHDLRHDSVVVADDAGEDAGVIVVTQAGDEVVAEFVFHAACAQALFGKSTAAQFAQCARKGHEEPPEYFYGLYAEEMASGSRLSASAKYLMRIALELRKPAAPDAEI
jgi:hypothetical protein